MVVAHGAVRTPILTAEKGVGRRRQRTADLRRYVLVGFCPTRQEFYRTLVRVGPLQGPLWG